MIPTNEKIRVFLLRNVIVGGFIFLLAILVFSGIFLWFDDVDCYPIPYPEEIPSTPYWEMLSQVQLGECHGNQFSKLQNNKLIIECEEPKRAAYAFHMPYSKFRAWKVYTEPIDMPSTEEFVWTFCGDLNELGDELMDKQKILNEMDVLYRHIPSHKNQFTQVNTSTLPKNVILLMLSSVSQEHFFRSLPKTVEWLAALSQDPEYYVHGYDSYYTMEFESLSNQVAMYQGKPRKSSSKALKEKPEWIWKQFKDQGFITMFSEEDCSENSFINRFFPNQRNALNSSLSVKNTFTSMVDDSFSLYCEPELRNPQSNNYFWKYGTSCIRDKPIHRITMDYLAQFLQNHKDQKKFAHVVFKQGVEPTMQRLQQMDTDFTALLQQLRQFNYLKDSVVFILSEQGSVDTPYYRTQEGKIEHRKPFLFVLTQRDIFFRHPTFMMNLVRNRDNMVTAFDIYQTLKTLANLHKAPTSQMSQPPYHTSNFGFSLTQEMPISRTCQQSHINKNLCKCSRTPIFYLLLLLPLPFLILCWWVFTWCAKGIRRPLKTVPVSSIQIN